MFSKELDKKRAALDVPAVASSRSTERIFNAINEWRLGAAQELLDKLAGGSSAEAQAASIETLQDMLAHSESHYRQLFCDPHRSFGYLPECVEGLERLGSLHCGDSERGARIAAEVADVKSTTEYATAQEQRELYREMLKAFEAMDDAATQHYEKAHGKRQGYDEGKYMQAVVDVYPATITELREYVRAQRESPYMKEIAILLLGAQEDLQ